MRFRYWFMFVGMALVLTALFVLDPLGGAATSSWLLASVRFVVGVTMVFFGYRAVTDYDEADGKELHKIAKTSPLGAGLAIIARALVFIAMALVFMSVSQAGELPAQAYQHLPTLK